MLDRFNKLMGEQRGAEVEYDVTDELFYPHNITIKSITAEKLRDSSSRVTVWILSDDEFTNEKFRKVAETSISRFGTIDLNVIAYCYEKLVIKL